MASVVYDLPTDQSYGYTYDNMGNIATYTDANGTVTYTYDAQGQLLSATDGTTTYSYTYDIVGNILTANGHTYSYTNADWKDLLTAYDGETITYDAIGNPLSYYNGTRWTFTWEDGRQLATATDGTTSVSYTYDSDGIRTSKTVNGVKHTYVYASGKLSRETYGDTTLDFFYSTSGQPYALKHNGTIYYYITNLQGDVMSIVDGTGAVVVSYKYDPYGNILSTTGTLADTLGQINPLRYRGYVYDQDTDLYYLQSRYYDSKVGRFINADVYLSTGQGILGNNMFAYCNNNPVNYTDPTGETAVVEIIENGLWILPLVDGPIPIGDIIALIGLAGLYLYGQSRAQDIITSISSNSINWGAGNKNHILKGTKRKHENGWKRFGIDPDDNNAWNLVLPILKEVIDDADSIKARVLIDGSMIVQYFKIYAEKGVEVMVKIWIDASGKIHNLSDAIPYIIDK